VGRPRAVGAFPYFGVTLIPVAPRGRCPRNKEYSLYPAIARVCGLLSAILTKILINTLPIKFNLPVLSIPFVLVSWAFLIFQLWPALLIWLPCFFIYTKDGACYKQ
jgi:hypothetical protein